jgi:hypothetical protein
MQTLLNTSQNFFLLQEGDDDVPDLSWKNVAVASAFILVNGKQLEQQKETPNTLNQLICIILVVISLRLGLKLEKSLLTSSIRCIVQLTIMVNISDI